jgi:hypothetical protein
MRRRLIHIVVNQAMGGTKPLIETFAVVGSDRSTAPGVGLTGVAALQAYISHRQAFTQVQVSLSLQGERAFANPAFSETAGWMSSDRRAAHPWRHENVLAAQLREPALSKNSDECAVWDLPVANADRDRRSWELRSVTIKRTFDIIIAIVGLLLTSPLLAGTAVAIRLTMGRPVLFTQVRPGLGGTMRPALCPEDEIRYAERLTRLGRRLRRSSIDELLQPFNVVRGDLSPVGPRPLLMDYLPRYNSRQARRHDVRPVSQDWPRSVAGIPSQWNSASSTMCGTSITGLCGLTSRSSGATVRCMMSRHGVGRDGSPEPDWVGNTAAVAGEDTSSSLQ